MSRYIDTDTLEEKAKQYSIGYYEADEWAVPLCEISEAPSIDIVFCKECTERDDDWCMYFGNIINPDDFCSYGEREGE